MASRQSNIGFQCRSQYPQQRHRRFDAAFFYALNLVGRHGCPLGKVINAQPKCIAPVLESLAEGQRLADSDSLGIINAGLGSFPAGVVPSHHTCLP